MRIYLFEDAEKVSNQHHSGGSVMVIAPSRGDVEALLEPTAVELDQWDWENVLTFPTHNYIPPQVFIFPDAGCC